MGLLDLLLPERCAGCGLEGDRVCAACLGHLRVLAPPVCERCGTPVAWPVARCRECAGRRLAFARARSAIAYEGVATRLVSAWKDGGRRRLAAATADVVAAALPRPDAEAIAFVPHVADRGLWRGHNPAQDLAAALSARWEIPVQTLLGRSSAPRPQRGLGLAERRRNVRNAFTPARGAPGHVVLVDDVYTSGATVSAAAQALRAGGAAHVEVVTFARALRGR